MAGGDDSNANQTEQPLVRELVGYVWVDSGQLVLTDPEYIAELDQELLEEATDLRHRKPASHGRHGRGLPLRPAFGPLPGFREPFPERRHRQD